MILVKCSNSNCPLIEWDESEQLEPEGKVFNQSTPNAERLLIPCPCCGKMNAIWVTGLKSDDEILRGK